VGPKVKRLRCAIYTRKSSEEGLEQAFNSLAAQREACIAFIESQRHEGWRVLEAHMTTAATRAPRSSAPRSNVCSPTSPRVSSIA